MTLEEFNTRADSCKLTSSRLYKRSVLSIRGGAGVFENILGGGNFRRVLEIGTYRGVSAAYLAGLCERVITVDLRFGMLEKNGETFDRQAFWSHMGISNIDLHLVRDNFEKAQLIASLEFDIAFIDGGHNREEVAADFEMTKRCGHVLFHDYDQIPPRNGVFDFVNSLPAAEVKIMDIFAYWRRR